MAHDGAIGAPHRMGKDFSPQGETQGYRAFLIRCAPITGTLGLQREVSL